MQRYIQFLFEKKSSLIKKLQTGFKSLSKKEFFIVVGATFVSALSLIWLIIIINNSFLVSVPADGGKLTEGIVGIPTLVNPVVAFSDADKDLTSLVYSGLVRKMPNGGFIPDLAESYEISKNGTEYNFKLKNKITFHDGTPITTDDIIFTINQIKDPLIKSPRKIQWEGVTVQKVDDKNLTFTLKQPYASFMDNLTIGILPMKIWKNISPAEFSLNTRNIKAIGSGPYMISNVTKNTDGTPNTYTLKRFNNFALGKPHIKQISITSYSNEGELIDALKNGDIDQAGGINGQDAKEISNIKNIKIETSVLPRMFGLFFNSNENKLFANKNIIQAINVSIDKEQIVNEVLYGYGKTIDNPIPESFIKNTTKINSESSIQPKTDTQAMLSKMGFNKGTDGILTQSITTQVTTGKGKNKKTTTIVKSGGPKISFSLTTGDTPELKQTAELIKQELGTVGIEVNVKIYETGALNQIIRSRKYEALLFGQVLNHESDLYAFWHSSQKSDPGLNIALYGNSTVDALLESSQKTLDENERSKKYLQIMDILKRDMPAIYIYSPEYIYALSKDLHHENQINADTPKDRFKTIYEWYADTDKVWKLFN